MNKKFYAELKKELVDDILPYWPEHAKDLQNGGFFGAIDNSNKADPKAWRSIVMVSRFLWSYSAAARLLNKPAYLEMADYSYNYMMKNFLDIYNGGTMWSVKSDGTPELPRKQIYGDAFTVYAISEYAAAIKELRKQDTSARYVMSQAVSIYQLLEEYALDKTSGGYFEALTPDWKPTKETSLSSKDIDCAKSMNTNLHVMEAYTNLYRTLQVVCPEDTKLIKQVGKSLGDLIIVHIEKILNKKDYHLDLYFDKNWKQIGHDEISYGHDIEASWLLWEAATELQNASITKKVCPVAIKIAEVALEEGFDKETGGFENFRLGKKLDTTRVWWNQAEAVNGFYNAWEMTKDDKFADAAAAVWNWIKNHQIDKKNGEWFASVTKEGEPIDKEMKGGNWKTSYHNGRTCMEMIRRGGMKK